MLVRVADLHKGQAVLQPLIERATHLSGMWDHFIEHDEGDMHTRRPGIHASELGCARKVVYSLTNAKKDGRFAKKWKQRFKMGHALHRMVQVDFLRMAAKSRGLMRFEDEVKIGPEHQAIAAELLLDSSADGVFTFYDDPFAAPILRIGLEIKSEAQDGYEKLTAPKPDHVRQAHLYMKALDLPLMWFLYINKNNQNNTPSLAPWLIPYDEREWQAIEAECRNHLKAAEEYPKTGVLPARTEGIFCEFCSYRLLCKPNFLQRSEERKQVRSARIRVPVT